MRNRISSAVMVGLLVSVGLTSSPRSVPAADPTVAASQVSGGGPSTERIPVLLDLPDGISQVTAWPITFGVPFPRGGLKDAGQLRLVDDRGTEIPAQKEVTGLWAKEGPIKWVRFDAIVSSDHSYFVETGRSPTVGDVTRPATLADTPRVKVSKQAAGVVLDTGVARYVLGRGLSPIAEIYLGQRRVATSAGTRGLYVVDQQGRVSSAATDGETMEIEASGPITACVRFEGNYRTRAGEDVARHITRVEVFAGQPSARITHTLIITQDTFKLWFKEVGWELAAEVGDGGAALFGTTRDSWEKVLREPLAGAREVFMLQDQHYVFAHGKNHSYVGRETADGNVAQVASGEECGDWAAVAGPQGGLMVSCRDSARQHPKEFAVAHGRLTLRLFSNRAGEELDFRPATLVKKWDFKTWYDKVVTANHRRKIDEIAQQVSEYKISGQGWAKTHEILWSPLPEGVDPAVAARLSRLHSEPVLACADPRWICQSGAVGPIQPKLPDRFNRAEEAIDAAVRFWEDKVANWGDYGFIDYFMGPHLEYIGNYARQYRYSHVSYTLRPDLWLLYARSGQRRLWRFAAGTNRHQMDGAMAHCDGPRKTRGLFLASTMNDADGGCALPGHLPFYWEAALNMHIESSSNLNCYLWDYYLNGYRQAKDVTLEYIDGLKRTWTPAAAQRDQRALVLLKMLTQAYSFTWDPQLKDLAEATMDVVYRPDTPLGLFQKRTYYTTEERNTSYKTQVDLRGVIDAAELFGGRRYHDVAVKLTRYWWEKDIGEWPLFYCNPLGVSGNFLYRETGDWRYPQGLAIQVRQAASAYDREKKEIFGVDSAEKTTFLLEGIPYAQEVFVRSGADRGSLASWAGFEDFGNPASIVVQKSGSRAVRIDVWPEHDLRIVPVGKARDSSAALPWIVKGSYNNQSMEIPATAPDGAYEIVPAGFGLHLAVANAKVPLVIHAPGYWRPAPPQSPNVRYYFRLPERSRGAQLVLEGSAQLFDPSGEPWPDGQPLHGTVDLPASRPGLWSFRPVDNQLVLGRNFPPFFAVESAESFFEPTIAWPTHAVSAHHPPPSRTTFVTGAINRPHDQALFVSRQAFRFDAGPPHPSGDGRMFLPYRQGTIEFWISPSWNSGDLSKGKTFCRLEVPGGHESYSLRYNMAPRSHDATADFHTSHVLFGHLDTNGFSKKTTLRSYRRTAFAADQWVHVAWVWGQRNGLIPNTVGNNTKPHDEVLVSELYIDGRLGQQEDQRWLKNLPIDIPSGFNMSELDGAVDELRISDVQRYTADCTPPSRDREFKVDEHTRALFHFNGDLRGESYRGGPIAGQLK